MLNSLLLQSLMEAAKPKDEDEDKKKKKADESPEEESQEDDAPNENAPEDDAKNSELEKDASAEENDDTADNADDIPEDGDNQADDEPPADDFSMNDDDTPAEDDDPPPDGLADPDAEDESTQDIETNVHVNILSLSKIDRALAKKKLLNDYFTLRTSMKTMLTVIDNNQAVMAPEIRDPLITDINQLYDSLTDYITIKFSYINYEENLQNYIIFSKSFEEMIQRANTDT